MKREIVPELRFPEFRDKRKWKLVRLSQLGELVSGLTYRPDDVQEEGLLVLRSSNVQSGYLSLEDKVYVRRDIKGANLSKPDDILICVRNGSKPLIGKNALIPKGMPPSTHGAFMAVFRSKLAKFVFQLFQTSAYERQVAADLGATINSINGNQFKKYEFYVPELAEEQQKIADCLSSLDELIAAHTQKHQALKSYKKGLLQNLFPTEGETLPVLRFPEFEGAEAWESIKLIDVTDKGVKWSFIGGPFGSNLKSSDYVEEGVRIIQLQNIGDAEFIDEYKIFTSEEKANELLSNNIYPGDIILSKMGDPVGRACLIPDYHPRYVMCSDGIRLVVDEAEYNKYFIYTLINSDWFRALVDASATGSTRKRIGLDILKKLPLIVPKKLEEQQKIADCLSSVDELITAQGSKIDELKAHKKGLMQQLFPAMNEVSA